MSHKIGAVVMGAGLSRRMGQPKLVLPWGQTTVIGRVVTVLAEGGAQDIVVVTGGSHQAVVEALMDLPAHMAFNPDYENGEMLYSLRTGLMALGEEVEAALVALGDQPQIQAETVRKVIQAYTESGGKLIAPSYQMRRGHPWLIQRELWAELFAMQPPEILRDFLQSYAGEIQYLVVDTPTVLKDLDTPEDYDREKPGPEES